MKCPECKEGNLEVTGTDEEFGDLIEVECNTCGYSTTLEPDGLGEGGMEWVDAKILDFEKTD